MKSKMRSLDLNWLSSVEQSCTFILPEAIAFPFKREIQWIAFTKQ
ncbi:MAG: hypothetical protein SAK29_10240 [Scytonema sp. PMC 1069.18]|nr:hypothetical protein [Scytonema sp. PMC 1069.18]MEC4884793.1 hypothetical protein [Scytonema sp. PMC 1070.18]